MKHTDFSKAKARMAKIKEGISPSRMTAILDRVALQTKAELIKATPKRTGNTRRAWVVEVTSKTQRTLRNLNTKVINWLEFGTANGGTGFIYPKVKKFLFIPLKRSVFKWHSGLKYGRDYILRLRVRGIKPYFIVRNETPKARQRLKDAFVAEIRKAIHGSSK